MFKIKRPFKKTENLFSDLVTQVWVVGDCRVLEIIRIPEDTITPPSALSNYLSTLNPLDKKEGLF